MSTVAVTLAGLPAVIIAAAHFHRNDDLVMILWAAWGVLALRVAFRILRWAVDYFIVTSDRLLMITGLLTRQITMIPLARVNHVSLRPSYLGRRLGYDALLVQWGNREQAVHKFQYMPYGGQLRMLLSRLRPPAATPCETCDGGGTVFRLPRAVTAPPARDEDYQPADEFTAAYRRLRRIHVEVLCPTCKGRG